MVVSTQHSTGDAPVCLARLCRRGARRPADAAPCPYSPAVQRDAPQLSQLVDGCRHRLKLAYCAKMDLNLGLL